LEVELKMKHHMTYRSFLGTAALLASTTASLADVTAQEVWNGWKTYAESTGQTLNIGSRDNENGAIILHNISMNFDMPNGKSSASLERLEFRERGDGTVAVTMSPDLPISISTARPESGSLDLTMIAHQTGLSIVASGTPENINFDYLASRIALELDKLFVDGDAVDLNASVAINDSNGKYSIQSDSGKSIASSMRAASLAYDVVIPDPEKGGKMTISGKMNDISTRSSLSVPTGLNMADPAAMFASAFSGDSHFKAGASSSHAQLSGQPDEFTLDTSSDGTTLDARIGDGGLSYGGSSTGVKYAFRSPSLPFPELTASAGEIGLLLAMPMARSDTDKDFSFKLNLKDVEFADALWNMFDPGQVMPRDPTTLSLDISGRMHWLVDLFDQQAVDNFPGDSPLMINKLTINDVEVSTLGARVTGKGDFTFDNSDTTTFKGMPAPAGAIDLTLVGVYGLLDRLGQMGILPQDQAAGVTMMLGLFARPGGDADTLVSKIEVKGDGSVFANGQQLK